MSKEELKAYEDPHELIDLSEEDGELLFCKHCMSSEDQEFSNFIFSNFEVDWLSDKTHKELFEISRRCWEKYKTIPSKDLFSKIFANKKFVSSSEKLEKELSRILSFDESGIPRDYVKKTIETFIKHRATYNIIASYALDIHREGVIPELIAKLSKTLQIEMDSNIGIEYFDNIQNHLDNLQKKERKVSFGLKMLDKFTGGGLPANDTCLFLFMAPPGLGKSQFMMNIARNWVLQDKKVLVISCEMSEEMYSKRFDALFTGISTRELESNIKQLKSKLMGVKAGLSKGSLRIKEFPTGTLNCLMLREYLKKLKSSAGFTPDIIFVDYLNIMAPNRGGAMSLYERCGYIAKELRAISSDYKIPIVSATQQARGQGGSSGYATENVDLSNVSESSEISATADAIVALTHTSEAEREMGRLFVKILKNRLGGWLEKFYVKSDYGNTLLIEDCEDDLDDDFIGEADEVAKKDASKEEENLDEI